MKNKNLLIFLISFLFFSLSLKAQYSNLASYPSQIYILIDSNHVKELINDHIRKAKVVDTVYVVRKDTVFIKSDGGSVEENPLNNYLTFLGQKKNNDGAYLVFRDYLPASVGTTAGRYVINMAPLDSNHGTTPFLLGHASTSFGNWKQNQVVMWGHNLSYGGGSYIPGQHAIGYSLEQEFKPNGPGPGLTESHEYYVNRYGRQYRLKSYTIDTRNDHIDFYHTTSNFYIKEPESGFVYLRAAANAWGNGTEFRINGQDAVLKLGGTTFQHIDGNGRLNITSKLRLEGHKAPYGEKYYLKIDHDGDVESSPW